MHCDRAARFAGVYKKALIPVWTRALISTLGRLKRRQLPVLWRIRSGSNPDYEDPTWFLHAIGQWEKDTLVVDRVGFNEGSWLGAGAQGLPHTDMLHLIERYRRPDLGHLEIETSVKDPGAYGKSWTRKTAYELRPKEEVHEYVCNENNLDPVNVLVK